MIVMMIAITPSLKAAIRSEVMRCLWSECACSSAGIYSGDIVVHLLSTGGFNGRSGIHRKRHRRCMQLVCPRTRAAGSRQARYGHPPVRPGHNPLVFPAWLGDSPLVDSRRRALEAAGDRGLIAKDLIHDVSLLPLRLWQPVPG